MAVTSQIRPTHSYGEFMVGRQWRKPRLVKSSAVKPVVTTIEKGLIIKPLGKLTGNDQRALQETVRVIVGQ